MHTIRIVWCNKNFSIRCGWTHHPYPMYWISHLWKYYTCETLEVWNSDNNSSNKNNIMMIHYYIIGHNLCRQSECQASNNFLWWWRVFFGSVCNNSGCLAWFRPFPLLSLLVACMPNNFFLSSPNISTSVFDFFRPADKLRNSCLSEFFYK